MNMKQFSSFDTVYISIPKHLQWRNTFSSLLKDPCFAPRRHRQRRK